MNSVGRESAVRGRSWLVNVSDGRMVSNAAYYVHVVATCIPGCFSVTELEL